MCTQTNLLSRAFLVILCTVLTTAKIYERCELAEVLFKQHDLPLNEIAHWVCIAQHSSQFNTHAYVEGDDSGSHGLFQISDQYWCVGDRPRKAAGCNIHCNALYDSNLADDMRCLQRIYKEHQRLSGDGYLAWKAYEQHCFGEDINSYIDDCKLSVRQDLVPKTTNPFLNKQELRKQLNQKLGNPFFHQEHTLKSNFKQNELKPSANHNFWLSSASNHNSLQHVTPTKRKQVGKVYNRCELAQELYYKHDMPMAQVPTWVCIAQHESRFDTSAVGRQNADGSADHGLFQISDLYWCGHDRFQNKACGMQCNKLLDGDITDDVHCVKRIHTEHTRIAGDGFTAWTVYEPHCRHQIYKHVESCFGKVHKHTEQQTQLPTIKNNGTNSVQNSGFAGKLYKRCESAQELYFKHHFSMQNIATWICIVENESHFQTAAVVKSPQHADRTYHGLFQISDQYWCKNEQNMNRTMNLCDLDCEQLRNSDLNDDVECVRRIYEIHGFRAWPAYTHQCRRTAVLDIEHCFRDEPNANTKVYTACELAQELYYEHKLPMIQIPTWVCIARLESQFNTAAIGSRNADGSEDFGLFQISDLYWCSHNDSIAKACNVPCYKLLDKNISDDVHCIQLIYNQHMRLFGDGFSAWSVYEPFCQNQTMEHISDCFNDTQSLHTVTDVVVVPLEKTLNPFFSKISETYNSTTILEENSIVEPSETADLHSLSTKHTLNPFLFKVYNAKDMKTPSNVNPFLKKPTNAEPTSTLSDNFIHAQFVNPFLTQDRIKDVHNNTFLKTPKDPFNVGATQNAPNPFLLKANTTRFSSNPFLHKQQQPFKIDNTPNPHIFKPTKEFTNKSNTHNPFLLRVSLNKQQKPEEQIKNITLRTRLQFTTPRPYTKSESFRQTTTSITTATATATATLRPATKETLVEPLTTTMSTRKRQRITTTRTTTVLPILETPKHTVDTTTLATLHKWNQTSDNVVAEIEAATPTTKSYVQNNNRRTLTNWHWKNERDNAKIKTTYKATEIRQRNFTTITTTPRFVGTTVRNRIKPILTLASSKEITKASHNDLSNITSLSNKTNNNNNINKERIDNTRTAVNTSLIQTTQSIRFTKTPMKTATSDRGNIKFSILQQQQKIQQLYESLSTARLNNRQKTTSLFLKPFAKNFNRTTTTTPPPSPLTTTINSTAYDALLVKENPFSHPFFQTHKEQLQVFATTTTKRPFRNRFLTKSISNVRATTLSTIASEDIKKKTTMSGHFVDYNKKEYFQRYRSTSNKMKPAYAFKFGTNVN